MGINKKPMVFSAPASTSMMDRTQENKLCLFIYVLTALFVIGQIASEDSLLFLLAGGGIGLVMFAVIPDCMLHICVCMHRAIHRRQIKHEYVRVLRFEFILSMAAILYFILL